MRQRTPCLPAATLQSQPQRALKALCSRYVATAITAIGADIGTGTGTGATAITATITTIVRITTAVIRRITITRTAITAVAV
jgi:hypothetical protein